MSRERGFRLERKLSIDWGFLLWALRKRLPFIVSLTILSLSGAALYELKAPKFYEASSLIRLRNQIPHSLFSQLVQQPQVNAIDLKTATQLVTTSLTAQEALRLIQERELSGMDVGDSIRQYLSSLSIQDVLAFVTAKSYEPDLIRISVKHTSPEVAAALANAFAEAFIARLSREILNETSDERRFIETQIQSLQTGLKRIDKQIVEVEQQLSGVNLPNEARALVNFVKIFAMELVMVDAEIRDAIRVREQSQQITTKGPHSISSPRHIPFYHRVIEAERHRAELEERSRFLAILLRQTHRQLSRFPEQQRRLSDLVRQLQVLGQAYMSLLSRLQDVQAKEALGLSSATIVNNAAVPDKPASPDLVLLLFLALSGSLVVGVGLTFLFEFAKPTVRSSDELEQILGVPVLSVIPEAKLRLEPESLMRLMTSRRSVTEAIRTLRANLRFIILHRSGEAKMKTFIITSSVKGEGKSFVTAALGIAFAQIEKRVVVVDADLLNPDLHKFFGVDETIGLADVLKGAVSLEDALKETKMANLQLLPAGTHRKGSTSITPAELFGSEAMSHLLQRLKEQFDFVLIDTPSMTVVSDPSVLASMTDGVLLVVELGHVTRNAIQQVKEQLELAQANILGVVINKASRKRGYDYHDDYYRYLGYRD
ncbi:MAG: polysaccharide biosynthesis tyrosine autokinase [Armatimonadota bacterium]